MRIQEENQTLATITLQNYFRLYDKLSGMTGTALTEATEFMKIYELAVVQIPTNRPMVRMDRNDQVYKTREGKWSAVEREIAARNATGQPVLVGTISVEVSELLSQRLRRRGIEHSVLNAKPEYAEREGETIAEAGRVGAVTIATNMAGRGVDIKLGGNAEHQVRLELAKIGLRPGDEGYEEHFAQRLPEVEARVEADRQRVLDAGGLYIVGTERHESRRIDNQLRGRSGRQGDPGESRFFLSAEDELIRLFAGDRIYRILDRLGSVDVEGNEEPIEAGMLSKQIESAQRKVEEQHYLARKHTLEYDDVMNEQRRVIYALRDQVLEGANLSQAREEVVAVLERTIEQYTAGDYVEDWDLEALVGALRAIYPVSVSFDGYGGSERRADQAELVELVGEDAIDQYDAREAAARRGADARARALPAAADNRRQLARAPARHGLPARGHRAALRRPDRPAHRLQERGLHALRRPHEQRLDRVRAPGLQRPGAGRRTAGDRQRRRRRGAAHAHLPALGQLDRRRHARQLLLGRRRRRRRARGRGGRVAGRRRSRGRGAARLRRAAPRLKRRAARPQRPLLVRLGQEVQALPRRMSSAPSEEPTPARLAAIREQLALLADYL